jgi:hypothetical protein
MCDLPLETRLLVFFEHYGAPTPFGGQVRNYLYQDFGKGGLIISASEISGPNRA